MLFTIQFKCFIQNYSFRTVLPFVLLSAFANEAGAQGCCSGGSGSPIAGGTSQGVLADRQAEVSASFQHINTNRFQTGDKKTINFLDNYNSNYLYARLAYGVTERFTLSLESGYYFNRTQVALYNKDKITCSGIGDVILFPRYTIYTHNTEKTRDEITLGVGFKMPVGKYLDSSVVYTDPASGKVIFSPMPPVVMPTTGSQDFIFYGFGYRGYPEKRFSLFTSVLYVKKGWNPLGQRFGDYASLGLFAGKSFPNRLGVTIQLKGEWVDVMKYDKNIDFIAKYNFDVLSTGGQKLLFVPQLNYSYKNLAVYALTEIPLYQYVNGTAIASQYLFTIGFSYRFMTVKMNDEDDE